MTDCQLWLSHTAQERERDQHRDQVKSIVSYGNIYTDLRQGQGLGPIVLSSKSCSPVPCTSPGFAPCSVTKP